MAAFDQAAAAAILKTKYPKRKFNSLSFDKSPLYGMMAKDTDFGGDFKAITLRYGLPQGGSANFSKAQSNRTPSLFSRFQLTRVEDFYTASVKGQTLRATKNDANAMIAALTSETDGAIRGAAQSISISAYRNGSGIRGQWSSASSVASASLTLTNPADSANFERGMALEFCSTADGSGLRVGQAVISGIQRTTGIITFAAALNTLVPTVVNTDFVLRAGDAQAMMSGLDAWLVGDAVTATPFFTVNRQPDTERLAGILFNGVGGNIEEVLIECGAVLGAQGGSPDTVMMNPLDLSPLIKSLGAKTEYVNVKSTDPNIGYRAVTVQTEVGPCNIIGDRYCPKNFAYMLQMDTWEMAGIGDAPMFLDEDGNRILRETGADAYEIRVGYYQNIACYAPGWNAKIQLA